MIFARIRSAIFLRPSFGDIINDKPDLYGPFWIATTLIVVIIAASSLLQFFNQPHVAYDFDQLAVAASLVDMKGGRSTASPSDAPMPSRLWSRYSEDWPQWSM